jgi:glycosyltransferase involved in cell wall biosynthesis
VRVTLLIGSLSRAGAETQLVELALSLDRALFEPTIVLLRRRNDFAPALAAAGIPVIALDRRGPWDLRTPFRLYRYLRRARPDILHSYLFFPNLLAVLAARATGLQRVIVSQRCSYEEIHSFVGRAVARWAHRRAALVVANSEATRREELAAGFPPERIVTVPNCVRPCARTEVSRAALGLPDAALVLSLGQTSPLKGHVHLIDAWAVVRAAIPNATLILVGDGACRAALKTQARTLGIADSVRFLGFRSPAAPYLEACDLLVQPSLTEGMPNAVLEAMAAQKAVVASRVGGIPELVVHGETGLLVPPAQPEALAQALLALLRDQARRHAMGRAGHARARAHFSVASMVAATVRAYGQVLEARR